MTEDLPAPERLGGYIAGLDTTVQMTRLPDCQHGHALYSINGGAPEHIISPVELRAGDLSQLHCQELLDTAHD
jgi:hypothetical protein